MPEASQVALSDNQEPADLAAFRGQRAAARLERRRRKASANFAKMSPDYGREIPPRLNSDVPDMIDQVKACYAILTQCICDFEDQIVSSVEAGKLDQGERICLLEHYGRLQEAVDAATADALNWEPASGIREFTDGRGYYPDGVHRIADHAKYVYAVGTRDMATLQYRLSELAHTGRLDLEVHRDLQWKHCLPMWETLYRGTTSAVRDERTWDGGWQWSDNTYSDGRQVMTQIRLKNWQELEYNWPCKEGVCGDGPIQEHPRGSVCQITPVHDPESEQGHFQYHPAIEVEIEELIAQCGPRL